MLIAMSTNPERERNRGELKGIVGALLTAAPIAALPSGAAGVWVRVVVVGFLALTLAALSAAPVVDAINRALDEYAAGRQRRRRRRQGRAGPR